MLVLDGQYYNPFPENYELIVVRMMTYIIYGKRYKYSDI